MSTATGARMDRMYRHQRHIYDLSRKFYLLGRERAVEALAPGRGARICEIGCGTGRNLVALARRYPDAAIYGIDASEEMLKSARLKLARHGLGARIRVRRCLAEELDPGTTFGLAEPFDALLFSYALSMMPAWETALARALAGLRPGGVLAVVDFSQQRGLPAWFRRLLRGWLALFEVTPRAGLGGYFEARAALERGRLTHTPICRDYACILTYRKPAARARAAAAGSAAAGTVVDSPPVGG